MKSALLLTLCLVLAACGTTSTRQKVRLAVGGIGLQMYNLPITLAETLGYYKEEGVDVELENLGSLPKALQALVGDSADVASLSHFQNIQLAAEGQHTRSFFVCSRRAGVICLAAPSSGDRLRRPEDLKGALIGVASPGAIPQLFANYYLGRYGIQPADFRTASIGTGASAIAALESGRVHAACLAGGDHLRLLDRHPNLHIFIDTSTAEGMREIYGGEAYATGTLSAKQEWLDQNPDTARRLARALTRALQWIAIHSPEQILEKLPDRFRSPEPAIDLKIIRWGLASYTPDGKMPPGASEGMKRLIEFTIPSVRDAKIDLASTWTNDFLPPAK